jgi:hypothetical protein
VRGRDENERTRRWLRYISDRIDERETRGAGREEYRVVLLPGTGWYPDPLLMCWPHISTGAGLHLTASPVLMCARDVGTLPSHPVLVEFLALEKCSIL